MSTAHCPLSTVVCVPLLVAGTALAQPAAKPPDLDACLAGRAVAIVLVKDFMRIENTGEALPDLEFPRYAPCIDDEQIVLARWLTAFADSGSAVSASIAKVEPDQQGNLIHTVRLGPIGSRTQVLVTLTTLVARRERPVADGPYPIAPADQLPEEVRPFLRSTPMVATDHSVIRAQADELLSQTADSLDFARRLAALMKSKSYTPSNDADPSLPTAPFVLRYGGSCCGSAVAAAAAFRAAGIPAQLTYTPAGYVHGIVRFHLRGYGWVRMDATCGTGKLPLVQTAEDLGLVRLFDMPIEMESLDYAYAWPYFHNAGDQQQQFVSAGKPVGGGQRMDGQVRFAQRDPASPFVSEPFPHLEPGSWNTVLGSEPIDPAFSDWPAVRDASRGAVIAGKTGPIDGPVARLPNLAYYLELARRYDFAPSTTIKQPRAILP